MSNNSNDVMSLFEAPRSRQQDQHDDDQPIAPVEPSAPRNRLAVVGAILSFVPLVGLVLAIVGLRRSRVLGGVGRTVAVVGIGLSVVLSGSEAYVGMTAPIFDSGCLNASDAASRLKAIQADPGGDLTVLANELSSIYTSLNAAAGTADSSAVHAKLQSVANDVKALSDELRIAKQSGDITALLADETSLQADGTTADSYCHSL